MTTDTCAPPPEHAHRKWHWLQCGDEPADLFWWTDEDWWWPWPDTYKEPDELYREGWRYVGPAIPPQEGE